MHKFIKFYCVTAILIISTFSLKGQNSTFEKLKDHYLQKNFEQCYEGAQDTKNNTSSIQLLKALSFYKLPDRSEIKQPVEDTPLHTLNLVNKAKEYPEENNLQESSFLSEELKNLQEEIFGMAEKWYQQGRKSKATPYFNALHKTFDNSEEIYTNHYEFDDSYLVNHLEKQIDIPEEFREYYEENYSLLDKFYYSIDEYEQWNNPVYRMANTAKDEEYLTEDEKMVFYFLNLARMNPQLFRKTFLETRLRIRYHGDLLLKKPVYDTLNINQYGEKLSYDDFFELPVHKLYNQDLSEETIERFVTTKVIKETPQSTQYQYDIAFESFYNYLNNNKPELLNLRNLSMYKKTEDGNEIILFELYDKEFTVYQKEYKDEVSDHYHQSLFKKLNEMKNKSILYPNQKLFDLAECWAKEAGQRKLKGHDRVNCSYGYDAECCDYGNKHGLDIVLSLLIDRYVPDLGHRKVLLGNFSEMGVAIRPHRSSFEYNAVLDFFR
ncbi:MAG: hypothetical protein ACLFT6_04955 [Bacteroidales bacterium]